MVKLKPDPIAASDLIEYLDNHSDFSFEIETLRELIKLGFTCKHGGTYEDPATQIPREYDIRATRQIEEKLLRLAVECKNLRPNFPILISCLPRRSEEAFHELSISVKPQTEIQTKFGTTQRLTPKTAAMISYAQTYRLKNTDSLYPAGEFVGKSCDQVGRLKNDAEIFSGDSGIYNKWSQALSSAHDLISLIFSDGKRIGQQAASLVFPLVVVPNNRLWCVKYDVNGNRISDPELVNQCSFFVNRKYLYQSSSGEKEFVISHLEFVTSDGLLEFASHLCSKDAKKLFSKNT
ncbi:hypothetical protein H6F88_25200 [Oculatella sp. FACHB-28]|uniref:hypothetical protein n=1 Tax=Oculatella sp. FACHB-28 TaxID=2692845 RepID=UPI001688AA8F|nr:hypothetical protein [Oculatella sp. FACHB-28]MBD2059252.1 hypothetical protein [Oculatella sp. FACHB-28]